MNWLPFQRRRRPASVDGAIERYRRTRQLRPVVGLYIPSDYSGIVGVTVQVRGSGKWMRIETLAGLSRPNSEALQEGCWQVSQQKCSLQEACEVGIDLGESAAELAEELLARSGISLEDALAVSVYEPGVVWSDYDSRTEFTPLFQPQRFAERTGLNVIDALPSADLAAGGTGGPLGPLADWMIFADRLRPVTNCWRFLVELGDTTTIERLPPSDGLDAELPDIRLRRLPGLGILDQLYDDYRLSRHQRGASHQPTNKPARTDREASLHFGMQPFEFESRADVEFLLQLAGSHEYAEELGQLAVQGQSRRELIELFESLRTSSRSKNFASTKPGSKEEAIQLRQQMSELAEQVNSTAREKGIAWPDVFCSASAGLLKLIQAELSLPSGFEGSRTDIVVAGRGSLNRLVISELRRRQESVRESTEPGELTEQVAQLKSEGKGEVFDIASTGIAPAWLPAVRSATLGIMHIDQLPASLPWITRCTVPRLHGRLTPGRPVQWRKLVMEMADYHPPAMKLRDAV